MSLCDLCGRSLQAEDGFGRCAECEAQQGRAPIYLSDAQVSALECAGLEAPDGIGERLLAAAWDMDQLRLPRSDKALDRMADALRDLANAESDGPDGENRDAAARAAARSLTSIRGKILRELANRRARGEVDKA